MSVDFARLMQAYLMARSLADDPQVPNETRLCCHFFAILVREGSGAVAETWGNADAWRRRTRDN